MRLDARYEERVEEGGSVEGVSAKRIAREDKTVDIIKPKSRLPNICTIINAYTCIFV